MGTWPAYPQVLHRVESQVAAGQVAALGEAGRRGLPGGAGFKHVGAVVAVGDPGQPVPGRPAGRLAEALPESELAPVRVALAAGELAPGHAAVVVQTMDSIAIR